MPLEVDEAALRKLVLSMFPSKKSAQADATAAGAALPMQGKLLQVRSGLLMHCSRGRDQKGAWPKKGGDISVRAHGVKVCGNNRPMFIIFKENVIVILEPLVCSSSVNSMILLYGTTRMLDHVRSLYQNQ